jgi:hypothetical protein
VAEVTSRGIEHTAQGGHDAPIVEAQEPGESLGRFVIWLLAGTIGVLGSVFAFNVVVDPYGTVGTGLFPVGIPEDPAIKVGLMNRLKTPPQVLVLGSSRSMKVEPAYIRQKTGMPGFNAGVRSGTPIDAWAMVRYAHDRFPGVRKHYLWMLDVEAFRSGAVKSNLLTVGALARYFPPSMRRSSRLTSLPDLLSWQATTDSLKVVRARIQRGTSLTPHQQRKQRKTGEFSPDGFRRSDFNDDQMARGHTLDERLRGSIVEYRAIFGSYHELSGRQQRFFEQTLAAMNSNGEEPTIVISPVHPSLLAVIGPLGWNDRHRDVLAYLDSLSGRYRFQVADMSRISSFGGSPDQFFDGVHMRLANYHRLIDTVLAQQGGKL